MPYDRVADQCFAHDCGPAKPGMLMCWAHWKRVPRKLQARIWESNYVAHPEHESSRIAARASIAAKEGLPINDEDALALEQYGLGPDGHPVKVLA